MFRIRYYAELLDPSRFGWFIRLLNWLRYWLETWIQYRVLKALLKNAPMEKARKRQYVEQFWKDVRLEVLEWKGLLPSSIQSPAPGPVVEVVTETVSELAGKHRPAEINTDTLSRYLAPRRSQRYAKKGERVEDDTEREVDAFEPLTNGEVNDQAVISIVAAGREEAPNHVGGQGRTGEEVGAAGKPNP